MATSTLKLYTSAPLEKDDLEQRLEKKSSDVNSFKTSMNRIKETTYIKDKNHQSKKKYKIYKIVNTILE